LEQFLPLALSALFFLVLSLQQLLFSLHGVVELVELCVELGEDLVVHAFELFVVILLLFPDGPEFLDEA